MNTLLRNTNHRTWLLLVIATAATYWLREDAQLGAIAGFVTLAIAYAKGRLVVLDYMELRHAPRLWRSLLEGWLVAVTAIILLVYRYGLPEFGGGNVAG